MISSSIDIKKTISQAKEAEKLERWCWASILWRRVNEIKEAENAETIAQSIAENKYISPKLF